MTLDVDGHSDLVPVRKRHKVHPPPQGATTAGGAPLDFSNF